MSNWNGIKISKVFYKRIYRSIKSESSALKKRNILNQIKGPCSNRVLILISFFCYKFIKNHFVHYIFLFHKFAIIFVIYHVIGLSLSIYIKHTSVFELKTSKMRKEFHPCGSGWISETRVVPLHLPSSALLTSLLRGEFQF